MTRAKENRERVRSLRARSLLVGCAALLAFGVPLASHAAVTISADQTNDMTCSSGVCAPTATDAVLSVSDLENMLAAGNVTVTTTGSGVQANDIDVEVPLSWSTGSMLAFDAYNSIEIGSQIAVQSQAGLSLTTNDGGKGGQLSFFNGGTVAFANLSSSLTINGNNFALVNNIASLASGIAANPGGNFALANSYDASGDGTYSQSPIATIFEGSFEGLGNTIANVSINNTLSSDVGLFAEVEHATLSHIGLPNASVSSAVHHNHVGTLAGYAFRSKVDQASASGNVDATNSPGALWWAA